MSYQQALENLGKTTERAVLRDFGSYLDDRITLQTFVELSTVTISAAQQQGRYAAELALMSWLQAAGLEPVPAAAPVIEHYADSERVRTGLNTIVSLGVIDPDHVGNQLRRIAYAETVESSQQSFSEILRRSEYVDGWTRATEADACELCEHWARGGKTFGTDQPMPTHKGCTCTQVPTKGEQ